MKNYFISTNACCYDDFLRYYLNREFLKQMAVDNVSDPKYSSVYGPFGKQVVTAPYKKYELSELYVLRSKYLAQVKLEEQAEMMANGLGNPRRMYVRFM